MSELWYYAEGNETRGPIAFDQLIRLLSQLASPRGVLVWREGFDDWKAAETVREIAEKLVRPPPLPKPSVTTPVVTVAGTEAVEAHGPASANALSTAAKWSLWKSANIGLLVSAATLLAQVAGGRGFELANYAHTASAATTGGLIGQILGVPLIFVLIAVVRNLLHRRQPKSSASAVWGALTFVALLVSIFAALTVYGEIFFSSIEIISGDTRKQFIASTQRSCVQKQRPVAQNVSESQIDKYCTCVAEHFADLTTYKQLGTEPGPNALAYLKQKAETAANACR